MNLVSLIGRIVADPEMKYTNGGATIAKFRIAVPRRFKNDGQPDTDFLNCLAFGKTAEFVEKYFKKGMRVALNGSIQTGSYKNKDGQTVYTTDIVADSVEFVEGKQEQAKPEVAGADNGFMYVPDGSEGELPFE